MAKTEEKKAAPPPARVRKGTRLNLDHDDRRNSAGNVVYRTDGRKRDPALGERVPKVGYVPMMMARERRDKSIEPARFTERQALSSALGHGSLLDREQSRSTSPDYGYPVVG